MIYFHFEDIKKIKLKQASIRTWLTSVVLNERHSIGDVAYIFCSDKYLLDINKKYLKHNTLTDIITFDYTNPSPTLLKKKAKKNENKIISGDIFISLDRVKENAVKYKVSFGEELYRVMAHGVLHLMGYKDKTPNDAKRMRAKEKEALGMMDV